jgi:hypothetical protein
MFSLAFSLIDALLSEIIGAMRMAKALAST